MNINCFFIILRDPFLFFNIYYSIAARRNQSPRDLFLSRQQSLPRQQNADEHQKRKSECGKNARTQVSAAGA